MSYLDDAFSKKVLSIIIHIMQSLPTDISKYILEFLNFKDAHVCKCVCKSMNILAHDMNFSPKRDHVFERKILRYCALHDNRKLFASVLSAYEYCERPRVIVYFTILCIHHNNCDMLQKLYDNFPRIINNDINYILGVTATPKKTKAHHALSMLVSQIVNTI